MIKTSVILPTYNEKENIGPLIHDIFLYAGEDAEVIVVDDDSPDGTWKVVDGLAKNQDRIRLLRRIDKKGLTSALNDGIAMAKGDIVVWMDCDFSMPPGKIKDLLDKIDQGYDAAVASRFVKGGGVEIITESQDGVLAFLLSKALNRFIQLILGFSFKDYTSGFIALKKTLLERISLKGDYGEYFICLIYRSKKMGFKVAEIPYLNRARHAGVSKTGTNVFQYVRRGIKYIWVTLRLKISKT